MFLPLLIVTLAISASQSLKIEPCGLIGNYVGEFPYYESRDYAAGVHDGQGGIYFLGGQSKHNEPYYSDKIYKLNLRNDSVEEIGQFPHYDGYSHGVAGIDPSGNVYYQGGQYADDRGLDTYYYSNVDTFQLKPNGQVEDIGRSPGFIDNRYGTSYVSIGDVIYIFGGSRTYTEENYVEEYNMTSRTSRRVGPYPRLLSNTAAAYDGSHVYIFGGTLYGHGSTLEKSILRFDPTTLTVEELSTQLPIGVAYASVAIVNKVAVIIGGQQQYTGGPHKGIAFDLRTQTTSVFDLPDLPPYSYGGVAFYQSSNDKIYTSTGHILCVDTSFDCKGKPDGRYPHPAECSKFIICSNEIPHEMDCAANLHFNPKISDCDYPTNAGCE